MNIAKILLLSVVAILLIALLVDAGQRSRQLLAVHEAIQAGVRVTGAIPSGPTPTTTGGTATPRFQRGPETGRDGKPRLAADFLLPPDNSSFNPEWVRGTLKEFETLPTSLNPLISNLVSAGNARGLVNDSLCDIHPSTPNLWREGLAEQALIFDDFKLFVFHIRPGIFWQKPTIANDKTFAWLLEDFELTADDFAFNLEMINHPDVKCGHLKQYFGNAQGFAADRYTLIVRWSTKEYSNIASTLSLTPLPRHIYGRNADGTPLPDHLLGVTMNQHWFDEQHQLIGVGGYRLEKFVPDQSISFIRDPNYWGAGLHFQRIEWDDSVKEPPAQLVAFKNGQVHVHGLSPDQYKSEILDQKEPRFAKPDADNPRRGLEGELAWARAYGNSFQGMAWNCARPTLKDRRVRQALAHAFPKDRIFADVFVGLGRQQVGPVHPDYPSFNEKLVDFVFDIPKAKALLAEAGWSDTDQDGWVDREIDGVRKPLKLDAVYFIHSITWKTMLSIYRDSLRQVGVDLNPIGVDGPEWEKRSDERNFDGFIIGWQMGDLEDDFKQIWHSSSIADQGSNYASWSNPEADEVIEAHRNEFDYDRRIELSKRFQAICHEDQPYLFIRSGESVLIWQKRPDPSKGIDALDGVIYGHEHFHPLFVNRRLRWHLVAP